MQVIVDYFQLSQMKSCRKEPQRSRNYLLQQRTHSFNKIQNSFLVHLDDILDAHLLDLVDKLVVVVRNNKQFVALL